VARSKYRAVPTVIHGVRFASKAEARRYQELLLLGMAGEIRNLELQPRFPLHVGGVKVGDYVADFRYEEKRNVMCFEGVGPIYYKWFDVVEDVKGVRTPVYRMKKKHVEAEYGIAIREVR
jgi:hypothetical protein